MIGKMSKILLGSTAFVILGLALCPVFLSFEQVTLWDWFVTCDGRYIWIGHNLPGDPIERPSEDYTYFHIGFIYLVLSVPSTIVLYFLLRRLKTHQPRRAGFDVIPGATNGNSNDQH